MSDPRKSGFNYGEGWGATSKPPVYLHAAKLARQLAHESSLISARAWALEMALWRVRIAGGEGAKAKCAAPSVPTIQSAPSEWQLVGRTCQMSRRLDRKHHASRRRLRFDVELSSSMLPGTA